jgi:ERCC4-type nuclease
MIKAVLIDSREPQEIQKLDFGVPAVVTMLEAGDLWASCEDGNLLVFERKTPADLLASIGDNRLFLQAQKMRERSTWCYLVVTGWLTPTHDGKTFVNNKLTGWNWAAVQGALLDVQEAGVAIAYCDHDNGYPAVVERIARRERGERVLNPTQRTRVMTQAEQILTSLPGIGLERAQVLLQDRVAAHALAYLTWTEDAYKDIDQVAGIGPGIKANVRKALGLEPGETLELISVHAPTLTIYQPAQKELVTA